MTLTLAWLPLVAAAAAATPEDLEPMTVTGRDLDVEGPRAVTELDREDLEPIAPTHPSELFARIPGAWVTRGSG